jgi:two-component system copper resistance phosphate regulon response regulator CusR
VPLLAVNVLIVDRDPASRRYTRLALEQSGILCESAESPDEVFTLLGEARGGRFDILLLDVEPAAAKGCSLLSDLRARGLQIPAVFVTVRKSLEDRVRSLNLGADDYIVKPFEFRELAARLRAVLRRSPRSPPRAIDDALAGSEE